MEWFGFGRVLKECGARRVQDKMRAALYSAMNLLLELPAHRDEYSVKT